MSRPLDALVIVRCHGCAWWFETALRVNAWTEANQHEDETGHRTSCFEVDVEDVA